VNRGVSIINPSKKLLTAKVMCSQKQIK